MVSLWGKNSKNGEEENNQGEERPSSSSQSGRQSEDANERSRLLPRQDRGYLDPDDPAVRSFSLPKDASDMS